jgi:hypothetical protein
MTIKVYNHLNQKEYNADLLEELAHLDIYFQSAYLNCDALMQNGKWEVFTVQIGSSFFIYPYILLTIPDFPDYFDITSPYGYAGPFCNDSNFFTTAENAFLEFVLTKNIVTEFIRYHYLYHFNENNRFRQNIQNLENRTVVILNCEQDFNYIWQIGFSGTNRNLVRKMENEDFEITIELFSANDVPIFMKLYNATMDNSEADGFYYFSTDFYHSLIDELGEQLLCAKTMKDGIIYGIALFFHSDQILTYYLSARNLNYTKVPSTNFIISKMSLWATMNNVKTFNLGGGLSMNPDDRLFKFKTNFSKNTMPFYIGKRVHLTEIYENIKKEWIVKNGIEEFDKVRNVLQFYRL